MPDEPSTPGGARMALYVLVGLVVLSPWPFGSVHLRTIQAIALISLFTALGAFLWDGWHRQLQLPPRALLWPLLGLWALAVFQLVPLPEGLHRVIAPGSADVWHPSVPAAAAVLGPGPHPISLYPEATQRWIALTTGLVSLALAASPALRERGLLLRASVTVVGSGLFVAVYGLVARLTFGDKIYGVFTVPTIAPFGPFVSKNHFAGHVEMTACLALGLAVGLADEARRGRSHLGWLESRRAGWVVAAWGAVAVLVLAVGVSLSRGGVVSLVAGILAFAAIRFWTRRSSAGSLRILGATAVVLVVAGVSVASVLPSDARSRVLTLFSSGTRGPDPFRAGVWSDTLRLIASSPVVGSGFGAFAEALPRFKTTAGDHRVEHAESDVLEIAAEGGIAAGLLVVAAAISWLGSVLRHLNASLSHLARGLCSGALAGGVSLAFHSGYDFNLRVPSNALLFGLLLAAALSRGVPPPAVASGPESWPAGVPAQSWVLVPVACAILISTVAPWTHPRLETAPLSRMAHARTAFLRRQTLEGTISGHLARRPSDGAGWLTLGWIRLSDSRTDALGLASWGLRLDPRHPGLQSAAGRVFGSVRGASDHAVPPVPESDSGS